MSWKGEEEEEKREREWLRSDDGVANSYAEHKKKKPGSSSRASPLRCLLAPFAERAQTQTAREREKALFVLPANGHDTGHGGEHSLLSLQHLFLHFIDTFPEISLRLLCLSGKVFWGFETFMRGKEGRKRRREATMESWKVTDDEANKRREGGGVLVFRRGSAEDKQYEGVFRNIYLIIYLFLRNLNHDKIEDWLHKLRFFDFWILSI